MSHASIPGLRGTETHRLSVQLHRGHHDNGYGGCARCALPMPCPARCHADWVIGAAGDDPDAYDTPLWHSATAHVPTCPPAAAAQPPHDGFPIDGRGRRLSRNGFFPDRGHG